jgi:hypothetical protein
MVVEIVREVQSTEYKVQGVGQSWIREDQYIVTIYVAMLVKIMGEVQSTEYRVQRVDRRWIRKNQYIVSNYVVMVVKIVNPSCVRVIISLQNKQYPVQKYIQMSSEMTTRV